MPARSVFLLLPFLLAVPALAQTNIQARIANRGEQHEARTSQVVVPPSPDVRAARLQVLQQDASALSALSESVQSDLTQLQKRAAG